MQTIPVVKAPTLMDLLQQLIHLWAESRFEKNILADDRTCHAQAPIFSSPQHKKQKNHFFF